MGYIILGYIINRLCNLQYKTRTYKVPSVFVSSTIHCRPSHLTSNLRYATKEMSFVWSPAMKFTTWRKLWTALATAEQELGIEISDEQLEEMRSKLYDVDFDYAAEKEKEFQKRLAQAKTHLPLAAILKGRRAAPRPKEQAKK